MRRQPASLYLHPVLNKFRHPSPSHIKYPERQQPSPHCRRHLLSEMSVLFCYLLYLLSSLPDNPVPHHKLMLSDRSGLSQLKSHILFSSHASPRFHRLAFPVSYTRAYFSTRNPSFQIYTDFSPNFKKILRILFFSNDHQQATIEI